MVSMFILVLPLHFQIRKKIVVGWEKLLKGTQFRTVVTILSGLVLLLFVDSWKRANIPVVSGSSATQNATSSLKVLTTRAYNQRNVYISGFILYFMICIPVLLNLLTRLVKYETLIREQNSTPAVENTEDGKQKNVNKSKVPSELAELESQLEAKKTSLKALEIQVKNLNDHFDSSLNEKDPRPILEKKND